MMLRYLRWTVNTGLILGLILGTLSSGRALAQDGAPVSPAAANQPATINAQLAQDLATANGPVSFLVILKDQVDAAALVQSSAAQVASALDKRTAVYQALTERARTTQASLRQWLDQHGVKYTPHYLANMIEVEGDKALADQLRLRPEVARLARNPEVGNKLAIPTPPEPPAPLRPSDVQATQALTYGLSYTHADQLWAQGIKGQGIVVAGQDTGVQWNHPALIAAYRGWNAQTSAASHPYNWLDAFGRDESDVQRGCSSDPQVPCDDNGHGTHTLGTVVGDATSSGGTIIGMAPAAKWIACRNMRNNVGTPASYTTCFEFFMAPYPQGGDPQRDGKPALGAQVINNSWGCPPSEGCDADSLRQIVDTVRAAGIFVAASAGNDGPACSSMEDPIAIYDSAFTVGAHDAQGVIAYFSSRGPVTVDKSNRLKPDLSAPGVSIYSAYPNNAYAILSGTSMAAPHVAGAVALLWSAAPALAGDIDRTEQILLKSADPATSAECGADQIVRSPNYVYGYGRLNVAAAVLMAKQPVTLTVTVADADGRPNAGAAVQMVDERTGYVYDGTTNAAGQVQWNSATGNQSPLPGSYRVTAASCAPLLSSSNVTLRPSESMTLTIEAPSYCQILPQVYRP